MGLARRLALDGRSALALAVVVATGFLARSLAVLDPPCLPGPDGAYYFVQVRGILRGEGLPVPDLPLLFYEAQGTYFWGEAPNTVSRPDVAGERAVDRPLRYRPL